LWSLDESLIFQTGPGEKSDLLVKVDAESGCRWYLYDTTTSLVFGKKIGFVDEGRDVDGLLDGFRGSTWFLGLMAMFPYLLNPIVKLPIVKRFALPHSSDSKGVGKIMKVRVPNRIDKLALTLSQRRDDLVKEYRAHSRQSFCLLGS